MIAQKIVQHWVRVNHGAVPPRVGRRRIDGWLSAADGYYGQKHFRIVATLGVARVAIEIILGQVIANVCGRNSRLGGQHKIIELYCVLTRLNNLIGSGQSGEPGS